MGVNKEHKEFHAVDMSAGWETPAGYPAGIEQHDIGSVSLFQQSAVEPIH